MHFGAGGTAQLLDDDVVLERAVLILKKDQRAGLAAVLLEQDFLDHRDGVVGPHLDVLDLADAMALVEDVDGFHRFYSPWERGSGGMPEAVAALLIVARGRTRKVGA